MTEERQSTVRTLAGRLRGIDLGPALVFRGIPYAAPPVDALRFRPPVPHEPWEGVRDATAFGPVGLQELTHLEVLNGLHLRQQSEDCLTLNVWTPAADAGRRPVLVWIHGGAYVTGTGACEAYDGTAFAERHDIVVVTINYRLNVFGYLHLADLSPDETDSGNCGLLDQVAALQWVQDNISKFGGDPTNVTVAGESAGAMSVGALLAVPAARGMFQRAVLQSGAPNVRTRDGATAVTRRLLDHLDIPADAGAPAALRALPADRVEQACNLVISELLAEPAIDAEYPFAPVVDGSALPEDPIMAIRGGAAREVPLLIGTTLDEMQVMHVMAPDFYAFDKELLSARFAAVFGDDADRAASLYTALVAGTGWNPWWQAEGDRFFLLPAEQLAEAQRVAGGQAWMFLFAWRSPSDQSRLGAMHTMDVPFVFHTLDRGPGPFITGGPPDEVRGLADTMNDVWAVFVRTGSCDWPTYAAPTRATMVFDVDSKVADDPQQERRMLWDSVPFPGDRRSAVGIDGSGH
jgi:para-nitrobenzyl esterase